MPQVGAMPSVAIPRSRFRQDFDHVSSWNHGQLIPIDCFEVLPGDDISVHKAAAEIHMSQPIVPIMGNIRMKCIAMFVPMRLLWEHTEEFYGANKTSAGPQTNSYQIPHVSLFGDNITEDSLSHYLGKPIVSKDAAKVTAGRGQASYLKERGYYFCWSEWFRHQQLQNPVIVNTGDANGIGSIGGVAIGLDHAPMNVCKQVDYFTQATLYPQYGAAVELPLGNYAPLHTGSEYTLNGNVALSDGSNGGTLIVNNSGDLHQSINSYAPSSYPANVNTTNLYVDLSKATAAKINDIRYAFQLQKYLERSNYGSRFFEVLAVHYGVTSPDSRLQRPEYLGGKSAPIVIRTVLSTAGYSASTGQTVGAPGASSITMVDLSGLFSKGFVEPGYVYVFVFNNHERLYSQGLLREDSKFNRFEFYSPEFANLGDQAVLRKEIYLAGDASDDDVFGYVGHWDEYRYRLKRVSGKIDPQALNPLDFWTLADDYNNAPQLGAAWIEEDRNAIARCLVTGATGPDYIGDFFFEYAATRELPLYNIPGLVDHFGAL